MDTKDLNPYLFSLIQMFASACWQQMGKIPSQIDGKITKDLKSAQQTIDLLIMLKDKTKGNLSSTEEKMLTDTLSNLQMNYADEVSKEKTTKPEEKQEEKKEEIKN
ncbi:hypothetical protein MASR1M68_08170 [Elusimicrobiota bacterium]